MSALYSEPVQDQVDGVRALDPRPEGAYLSSEKAGLAPYDVNLFTIERVNGNSTVSSIGLTQDELRSVITQYMDMMQQPGGPFQRANAVKPQPVSTIEKSPNT